jgi:hypothetical protein
MGNKRSTSKSGARAARASCRDCGDLFATLPATTLG